ncbi:hypothetical protein CEXT_545941 [Caerostris extrusa]|uniref:Uncharacterized protein n=1 Tax=Caerostris extrusa TaxID=172846 RepID=A0AAV4P347_CAEEX|nr:hypothetical protein CEXT_545941 [Caerostris extrusa]
MAWVQRLTPQRKRKQNNLKIHPDLQACYVNKLTSITYRCSADQTFDIKKIQKELYVEIAVAKQWFRFIASITAEIFRLSNDERLNSSVVVYHPDGISHLAAKRIAVANQIDLNGKVFTSRKFLCEESELYRDTYEVVHATTYGLLTVERSVPVESGMSSYDALRIDFIGFLLKVSRISSTVSSVVGFFPKPGCLLTLPVARNLSNHALIVFTSGGSRFIVYLQLTSEIIEDQCIAISLQPKCDIVAGWCRRHSSFLRRNISQRWIRRDVPTAWPSRSPNTTPKDFLCQRYN